MKAEQILLTIKDWAKNGGHKIRASIKKQPPSWLSLGTGENEENTKGITAKKQKTPGVTLSVYESNDEKANSWNYWFDESGDPVLCDSGDEYLEELEGFKSKEDIENILNQSTERCYELWGLAVFRSWAEKNDYYAYDHPDMGYVHQDDIERSSGVIDFDLDSIKIYKTVSMGIEERPYSNSKIMPSMWHHMFSNNNVKVPPLQRLHVYSHRIKHIKQLNDWLDEHAKIGFLRDRCVKHLDKEILERILRNRISHPGSREIYLYELESATDEAINLLCSYVDIKVVYLSEKSLNSLKDTQIEKLIKSSILRKENKDSLANKALLDLNFDIGMINRKSLDERTAWNIVRYSYLPFDLRPTGSTLQFDLTEIENVSDECCEILSYCDLDRSCWPLKWHENLKTRVLKKEQERRQREQVDLQKVDDSESDKILKNYKKSIANLINKIGDFHPETLIQLSIICELEIKKGDLRSARRTSEVFVEALKKHKDSSLRDWLDLPKAEKRHLSLVKEQKAKSNRLLKH
jgi:hypothetical protein